MNNQDNYLIEFKYVEEKSIRNLLDVIEYTKGKPLNEFRIMDLTYHNGNQIFLGIGVYIFRNDKEIVLVSRVTSMSFTKIIVKHLDFRNVI